MKVADMNLSEVRHLAVYCGPITEDTPPAVVTLLTPESEEQLGMFSTCIDATIWVLGWTAAGSLIAYGLYSIAVLGIRAILH